MMFTIIFIVNVLFAVPFFLILRYGSFLMTCLTIFLIIGYVGLLLSLRFVLLIFLSLLKMYKVVVRDFRGRFYRIKFFRMRECAFAYCRLFQHPFSLYKPALYYGKKK